MIQGAITNGAIYPFRPMSSGKVSFRHLFGLSFVITQQARNALLLHGALAEHAGRGVILIAQGGTGKTTASQRLPSPWYSHSDDITLVVRDTTGQYWAHPWPTLNQFREDGAGGRWCVQQAVPLKHIYQLTQAETDRLEPVGRGKRQYCFPSRQSKYLFRLVRISVPLHFTSLSPTI